MPFFSASMRFSTARGRTEKEAREATPPSKGNHFPGFKTREAPSAAPKTS